MRDLPLCDYFARGIPGNQDLLPGAVLGITGGPPPDRVVVGVTTTNQR